MRTLRDEATEAGKTAAGLKRRIDELQKSETQRTAENYQLEAERKAAVAALDAARKEKGNPAHGGTAVKTVFMCKHDQEARIAYEKETQRLQAELTVGQQDLQKAQKAERTARNLVRLLHGAGEGAAIKALEETRVELEKAQEQLAGARKELAGRKRIADAFV